MIHARSIKKLYMHRFLNVTLLLSKIFMLVFKLFNVSVMCVRYAYSVFSTLRTEWTRF